MGFLLILGLVVVSSAPEIDTAKLPVVILAKDQNHCETQMLANQIANTPHIRVLREIHATSAPFDSSENVYRLRASAHSAGVKVEIRAHKYQKAAIAKTYGEALMSVWPKKLGKLGPPDPLINIEALKTWCQSTPASQSDALYIPLLPNKSENAPDTHPSSLTKRWSDARTLKDKTQLTRKRKTLLSVADSLLKGQVVAQWHYSSGKPYSSTYLTSDTIYVFSKGILTQIDLNHGYKQWDLEVGLADPEPKTLSKENIIIVLGRNKISAVNQTNGQKLWQQALIQPHPEMTLDGKQIIVSGSKFLRAFEIPSGKIIWEYDPLKEIVAGPVPIGSHIVLPVVSEIHAINPSTGVLLRKFSVGDEISGPLIPTPNQLLWVFVGGTEILRINILADFKHHRFRNLRGLGWPPLLFNDDLIVPRHVRWRSQTAFWLPSTGYKLKKLTTYDTDPFAITLTNRLAKTCQQCPQNNTDSCRECPSSSTNNKSTIDYQLSKEIAYIDKTGNYLVIHSDKNRRRRKARLPSLKNKYSAIIAADSSRVYVASNKTMWIYDIQTARKIQTVNFEKAIQQLNFNQSGGVVSLVDGSIYRWPTTLGTLATQWLKHIRNEIAQIELRLNRKNKALEWLNQNLAQNPLDIETLTLRAELTIDKPVPDVSDWMTILQLTHEWDPLHEKAKQKLLTHGLVVRTSTVSLNSMPETSLKSSVLLSQILEYKDCVISNTSNRIIAKNKLNGKNCWSIKQINASESTSILLDERLYLISKKQIQVINAETGRRIKRKRFRSPISTYVLNSKSRLLTLSDNTLTVMSLTTLKTLRTMRLDGILQLTQQNDIPVVVHRHGTVLEMHPLSESDQLSLIP